MSESNNQESIVTNVVYYRLICLWVVCESMLGGIIHGLKLPVSGLIVGSCAVVCISLIAWYVPERGAILKATLVVAIFKMMLSPQAPLPAYFAVFFQGLLGEVLFFNRRYFRLSCILFSVLALLESGLQRVLVLTIIYGNDLWRVTNDFINGLTKQRISYNYSLLIGSVYVAIHIITGFLVGRWASVLPSRVDLWKQHTRYSIDINNLSTEVIPSASKKRRKLNQGLLISWLILVGLYVQSYFKLGEPVLPAHISLKILLRSLIIIFAWIFIVGPMLQQLLQRWLNKKQAGSKKEIQEVSHLIPVFKNIISQSWRLSSPAKGVRRFSLFGKIVLFNTLHVNKIQTGNFNKRKQINNRTFILSGPIGTGKTTSLLQWAKRKQDIYGILSPLINGKRVFMDIAKEVSFHMEAGENEQGFKIGQYNFSKSSFEKASSIIKDAINNKGWLIIDEIGPLELRGEGFSLTLKEVLSTHTGNLLLVVREGLAEKVIAHFGIQNASVTSSIKDIEAG